VYDHLEEIERLRRHEVEEASEKATCNTGVHAAQCERECLVTQKVDAESLGRDLTVTHGNEGPPDARRHGIPCEDDETDSDDPREVIDTKLGAHGQRCEVDSRHAEATSPVGHRLPVQEHPLRELREAERCHGEIDAAES